VPICSICKRETETIYGGICLRCLVTPYDLIRDPKAAPRLAEEIERCRRELKTARNNREGLRTWLATCQEHLRALEEYGRAQKEKGGKTK